MNKGYVILAGNEAEFRQAAACAYSIVTKNRDASVSVIVPDLRKIADHWLEPFENAIELPFGSSEISRANDWQLYWASPYEYTIAVDCHSLVRENHGQLWDYLTEHYDICFPAKVTNFDGQRLRYTKTLDYRSEYNLKILNSHMFYFKKDTEQALAYFKMADPYMRNWQAAQAKHFAPQHVTLEYQPDIMHSLISECMGQDNTAYHENVFTYTDMRIAHRDGIIGRWEKWTDRLNVWASRDGKIKVQNFAVNNTLYYAEDDFLTEEIFNGQRDYYRTVTKQLGAHHQEENLVGQV
jgi:hypothetical protein